MTETPSLTAAQRALLNKRLESLKTVAAKEVRVREPGTAPPLSFAQERVWFMEQLAPGTAAYLSPQLYTFDPATDPAAVQRAWRRVLARHEALRMRFPAGSDGRPTVVIDDVPPAAMTLVEVPDEPAAAQRLRQVTSRPFDLATEPLYLAELIRVRDTGRLMLALGMHHIVTDGWSNDLVRRELIALLEPDGAAGPVESPTQYGDFAAHQRRIADRPDQQVHLEYWKRTLAGVPTLALPTDFPRPSVQTYVGTSHSFRIRPEVATSLRDWARAARATNFMALMTVFQIALARYTGQYDFAVGSPVAGRPLPELDDSVGMFVNMLPIRADLAPDITAVEALRRTKIRVLEALDHEQAPFEQVVAQLGLARDPSRAPLFQAMVVLQNYADFETWSDTPESGTDWEPVNLPATRFEIELHAYDLADGSVACRLVTNDALYGDDTAQWLIDAIQQAAADLPVADHTGVSALPTQSEAAGSTIAGWQGGPALPQTASSLAEHLVSGMRSRPDGRVIADGASTCSTADLDRRSEQLARELIARGIGPGSMVAVCIPRSLELMTALVGVLRSGAAYLPLDTDYPAERLAFQAADAEAVAVLVSRDTPPAAVADISQPVIQVDATGPVPAASSTQALPFPGPDDVAYLMYTSGSTGRPKGVINTHAGIVNRIAWMQQLLDIGDNDVVLQKTPAGFDVSVWEFFWPLVNGADLVLANPGGHRDPSYLRQVMTQRRVTVAHFVPSMLDVFLADLSPEQAAELSLRSIVCSGEELRPDTALRCLELLPGVELHNLYGPTEAAVDVTAWRCEAPVITALGRVPIGRPVPGVRIEIRDDGGRAAPIGALGQLWIGGVQVARGYHRRPELTAERFVTDADGVRWYATGDQARWRADGSIEFHGRLDGQVKLRGQRVELGEIESALRAVPGVGAAAVAVKEMGPGDIRLVGYLQGDAVPATEDLRSLLGRSLPVHMVPAIFLTVADFPLSPNGKLDRTALPTPEVKATAAGAYVEPRTPTEQVVADIWTQVLGLERVGATDNFFDLGGHSLLGTQVIAKLKPVAEAAGTQVGVMDLFQAQTVAELSNLIDGQVERQTGLLYQLTKKSEPATVSYVCVPYGGGSAAVYQPLADALPVGHRLFSVAIPGHDVGLDEEHLDFDVLARRCADEVLEKVDGPVVLYGHCGVGGALIVEMGRLLEAAGREIEAIYVGGIFPFARARGRFAKVQHWFESRESNRNHVHWLKSMGVDLDDVDPEQADRIVTNMRRDSDQAEEHFTELLATEPVRMKAPIISVVGQRDPITDYFRERYTEWEFVTESTAVVVLEEAGHFFLKYRAAELADIVTGTHRALASQQGHPPALPAPDSGSTWWLQDRHHYLQRDGNDVDLPSLARFLTVAIGQLTSSVGSQLAGWAIPIWILQKTGSLGLFSLTSVVAFVPVILASPIAGALADRFDRRRVILTACCVAAAMELVIAGFVLAGSPTIIPVFAMVMVLTGAGTIQRIAFTASIPQLVPKRYLGHANGVLEIINGAGQLFIPLVAAGLYGLIGLRGILLVDVISYAFAITVLAIVRFPNRLWGVRKESFAEQVFGGFRLTWRNRHLRAMQIFYGIGNLLYAPGLLMATPMILAFADIASVAQVAVAEGAGALASGVAMAIWGGPPARRMRVNIWIIGIGGLCVALTGLRPDLWVIGAFVTGTVFSMGLANGIYITIIQTKVAQRYHGRVFAVNQAVAWSTFPLGFLLAPWLIDTWFQPWMDDGGALAGSVGTVIGTGSGRGIALAFVIFGIAMMANAAVALGLRTLRNLDEDMPDAEPDDLLGAAVLAERKSAATGARS